jgi:hypothetical protein
MSTTTVGTLVTSLTSDIGSVLTANLPLILTIMAGLIGLGILIHYVRKWIGRK